LIRQRPVVYSYNISIGSQSNVSFWNFSGKTNNTGVLDSSCFNWNTKAFAAGESLLNVLTSNGTPPTNWVL
jgi:hypothetical protein